MNEVGSCLSAGSGWGDRGSFAALRMTAVRKKFGLMRGVLPPTSRAWGAREMGHPVFALPWAAQHNVPRLRSGCQVWRVAHSCAGTPALDQHWFMPTQSQQVAFRQRYNEIMQRRINVENVRPATVYETAKALGVSKKRTEELVRLVRQSVYRDAKTGQFVVRAKKSGTIVKGNSSRHGNTKASTTSSKRAKA